MKSNKISVERHEESLWRELTEEESENVRGGAFGLLLFNSDNIRNLLRGLFSQIAARAKDAAGQQGMIVENNGGINVQRTETIIIERTEIIIRQ